jgi:hypothetical protein
MDAWLLGVCPGLSWILRLIDEDRFYRCEQLAGLKPKQARAPDANIYAGVGYGANGAPASPEWSPDILQHVAQDDGGLVTRLTTILPRLAHHSGIVNDSSAT